MTWLAEPIVTKRLVLREFTNDDQPAIDAMNTDPDVREFFDGPLSDQQREQQDVPGQPGAYCIADKRTNLAFGTCVLFDRDDSVEIVATVLTDYQHLGYANEAIGALIEWIWDHTEYTNICGVIDTTNQRSIDLVQCLGFRLEERLPKLGGGSTSTHVLHRPRDR